MPCRISRLFKLSLLAGCSLYGIGAGSAAFAQDTTAAASDEPPVIVVLGSRIPRTQKEGPAPVQTITADQIRAGGYASVPDVLRTVSSNSGETQSQQSFSGADFSPGAQQVDLRGLGSNHTLVLVNGRRIADFPMPFGGRSNFTDVSNIPLGMVDDVEILSGAASAIYGSDAIAGVVNFKLKQHADGTTLDYRYGWEDHGGGASHRLNASGGYDNGNFHAVLGGEWLHKDPLWAYQRDRQDSTDDNPNPNRRYARRNYMRVDIDQYYVDPPAGACDSLAGQNGGSTIEDNRPDWGYYCGTKTGIGYGTIESQRDQMSGVASLTYDLNDDTHLFADIQVSHSEVKLLQDVTQWYYQSPTGNEEGYFYNSNPAVMAEDNWNRIFSPEEMGGLENAMRVVKSNMVSITPGVRGTFGATDKWNYELSANMSLFDQRIDFPQVIVDKANSLFLGPQLGVDTDDAYLGEDGYGYPVFNASLDRFYTPLTTAEYNSITAHSIYKPRSWVNNFSATVNTADLFEMPAGPVGFAAVAEIGRQGYNLNPDPKALEYYYLSWKDSDGHGGRDHAALGTEFSVPLLSTLQLSLAGRYDTFTYAGNSTGKFTYNTGLEYRPVKTLLLRAAFGTAFRAPDLHYVYTGPGNIESSGDDYYLCRTLEPDTDIGDCDYADSSLFGHRNGNLKLKPETAKSLTYGFVWAPSRIFDFSADIFDIRMANQVEDLDITGVLRNEADCRIGSTVAGTPVDANSPTCVDAVSRVHRYESGPHEGEVESVAINPINVANERTSGIDLSAHARFDTPIGRIGFTGNFTHVYKHTSERFDGDTPLDKLAVDSDYYLPRDKASASVNYAVNRWKFNVDASYISRLPNYSETARLSTYTTYNGSVEYDLNDNVRISLAIDNLFDKAPPKDPTWTGYPYYNDTWYDGVGRSGFLQVTYKFK